MAVVADAGIIVWIVGCRRRLGYRISRHWCWYG